MKTKLVSVLLMLAILMPAAVACGNPAAETEPDTGTSGAEVQTSEQPETAPPETETETEPEPIVIPEGALPIVVGGVSDFVIVRGENATPAEVTASTELQRYLMQITGAELPIVTDGAAAAANEIVVGQTNRETAGQFDRDELGTEGFIIQTDAGKLWLIGGAERGTLYAVYEFLEAYLGCRFYTHDFEKVPQTKTVAVNIAEDKRLPGIADRTVGWYNMLLSDSIRPKRKVNGSYWDNIRADYGGAICTWAGGKSHTLPELAETVKNLPYSRIPVYEGSEDNIVGILPVNLFLSHFVAGRPIVLRKMLLKPYVFDSQTEISVLLHRMRLNKLHMVFVTDESRRKVGIITMEDLLEELVGDIQDESDAGEGLHLT